MALSIATVDFSSDTFEHSEAVRPAPRRYNEAGAREVLLRASMMPSHEGQAARKIASDRLKRQPGRAHNILRGL